MRSELELIPSGFIDPFSWSINRWRIINRRIMNGIKKCRIKNRFSVGLATANPPHSH